MTRTIFDSVELNHMTLKNRLVRSATWEGLATADGSITDEAYGIYRELSHGGVGAVIVGFTDVSQDDHYIHGAMRLSRDKVIPQFAKLAGIIHEGGCPAIIQLAMGAYYRKLPNGLVQQTEQIAHTGALLIGTYDRLTYGDPSGFLRNINNHIPTTRDNRLIFIEGTGHTYQRKE